MTAPPAHRHPYESTPAGPWPDLIGIIAGRAPHLRGAACKGNPHLFDPAEPFEPPESVTERHAVALTICATCPELAACRAWFAGLPPRDRPSGVIAGQINTT